MFGEVKQRVKQRQGGGAGDSNPNCDRLDGAFARRLAALGALHYVKHETFHLVLAKCAFLEGVEHN
jgi:hypothetical protein